MKTTRTLLITALGVLVMASALPADVNIGAQLNITPRPTRDLEVYVWPDRGMDGVYYPGENINVTVEVTRDAFLILYNIDTRGRLHILFPASPWDDNFVQAGDAISFPRRRDGVDWAVNGPAGTEYIQVIASEVPISPPEWPVYINNEGISGNYYAPSELRGFQAGGDRYAYIDVVNRNISGRYYDWAATDVATFQVRDYPVYRTGYVDPWPDVFYGQIYIGWPIGSRIYIDGIYIGIAPLYVPRRYYGRRVITCYDGPRLIRRHEVNFFPKRDWYSHNRYRGIRDYVYKRARPDVYDHFQIEKNGTGKRNYRVVDRQKMSVYNGQDDDSRAQTSATRGRSKRQDDGYVIKRGSGKSASSAPARIDRQRKSSKGDPGYVIKRGKSQSPAPVQIDNRRKAAKSDWSAINKRNTSDSRGRAGMGQSAPKARTADVGRDRGKAAVRTQSRREAVVMKRGNSSLPQSLSVQRKSARTTVQSGRAEARAKTRGSADRPQKVGKGASSKRSKRGG